MSDLETNWRQAFDDLDLSCPPPCAFEELVARYSEPHRAYHTVQHLEECLAWFDSARWAIASPGLVALAILYHDAIYDTHARDNEERSADLVCGLLEEYTTVGDETQAPLRELILATRHNALPQPGDAEIVVDIDLAILGAARQRFDEYEQQVRREYDWVAEPDFRRGRADILRQFLARPKIYSTALFRERLESAARENLQRSLAALTF
ncbi:MAG TPA: hypothetical protein VIM02_04255 [Rhizomicrobium sp.]|jgi:predicted metal-dependent HD superfamily phosphohydrolase